MNLNTMSGMYQTRTGQALGFLVKSRSTGRLWTATHKTGLGKFVIATVDRQKEALVDGDQDRYEFGDHSFDTTGRAARRQELNEKLSTLTNREGELERTLETSQEELDDVQEEIETLEDELTGLEDDSDEDDI